LDILVFTSLFASSTRVIKTIGHPQCRPRVLHANLRGRRTKRWWQLSKLRPSSWRLKMGIGRFIRTTIRSSGAVSFRIQRLAAVSIVETSRDIVVRERTFAIRIVFLWRTSACMCWQEDRQVVRMSLLHEMRRRRGRHFFTTRLLRRVERGIAMTLRGGIIIIAIDRGACLISDHGFDVFQIELLALSAVIDECDDPDYCG